MHHNRFLKVLLLFPSESSPHYRISSKDEEIQFKYVTSGMCNNFIFLLNANHHFNFSSNLFIIHKDVDIHFIHFCYTWHICSESFTDYLLYADIERLYRWHTAPAGVAEITGFVTMETTTVRRKGVACDTEATRAFRTVRLR